MEFLVSSELSEDFRKLNNAIVDDFYQSIPLDSSYSEDVSVLIQNSAEKESLDVEWGVLLESVPVSDIKNNRVTYTSDEFQHDIDSAFPDAILDGHCSDTDEISFIDLSENMSFNFIKFDEECLSDTDFSEIAEGISEVSFGSTTSFSNKKCGKKRKLQKGLLKSKNNENLYSNNTELTSKIPVKVKFCNKIDLKKQMCGNEKILKSSDEKSDSDCSILHGFSDFSYNIADKVKMNRRSSRKFVDFGTEKILGHQKQQHKNIKKCNKIVKNFQTQQLPDKEEKSDKPSEKIKLTIRNLVKDSILENVKTELSLKKESKECSSGYDSGVSLESKPSSDFNSDSSAVSVSSSPVDSCASSPSHCGTQSLVTKTSSNCPDLAASSVIRYSENSNVFQEDVLSKVFKITSEATESLLNTLSDSDTRASSKSDIRDFKVEVPYEIVHSSVNVKSETGTIVSANSPQEKCSFEKQEEFPVEDVSDISLSSGTLTETLVEDNPVKCGKVQPQATQSIEKKCKAVMQMLASGDDVNKINSSDCKYLNQCKAFCCTVNSKKSSPGDGTMCLSEAEAVNALPDSNYNKLIKSRVDGESQINECSHLVPSEISSQSVPVTVHEADFLSNKTDILSNKINNFELSSDKLNQPLLPVTGNCNGYKSECNLLNNKKCSVSTSVLRETKPSVLLEATTECDSKMQLSLNQNDSNLLNNSVSYNETKAFVSNLKNEKVLLTRHMLLNNESVSSIPKNSDEVHKSFSAPCATFAKSLSKQNTMDPAFVEQDALSCNIKKECDFLYESDFENVNLTKFSSSSVMQVKLESECKNSKRNQKKREMTSQSSSKDSSLLTGGVKHKQENIDVVKAPERKFLLHDITDASVNVLNSNCDISSRFLHQNTKGLKPVVNVLKKAAESCTKINKRVRHKSFSPPSSRSHSRSLSPKHSRVNKFHYERSYSRSPFSSSRCASPDLSCRSHKYKHRNQSSISCNYCSSSDESNSRKSKRHIHHSSRRHKKTRRKYRSHSRSRSREKYRYKSEHRKKIRVKSKERHRKRSHTPSQLSYRELYWEYKRPENSLDYHTDSRSTSGSLYHRDSKDFFKSSKDSGSDRSYSDSRRSHVKQREFQQDKDKPIEERRVVYAGKIPNGFTKDQLRARFASFGPIEDVSLHFRYGKDNFGFVTFKCKEDCNNAVDRGNDDPLVPKLDISFGGRRKFLGQRYSDLDYKHAMESLKDEEYCERYGLTRHLQNETNYDELLKAEIRRTKRLKKHM